MGGKTKSKVERVRMYLESLTSRFKIPKSGMVSYQFLFLPLLFLLYLPLLFFPQPPLPVHYLLIPLIPLGVLVPTTFGSGTSNPTPKPDKTEKGQIQLILSIFFVAAMGTAVAASALNSTAPNSTALNNLTNQTNQTVPQDPQNPESESRNSSLTIDLDNETYQTNDTIQVSGTLSGTNETPEAKLEIRFNQTPVRSSTFVISNGTYSHALRADFNRTGNYSVVISAFNLTNQTTFYFEKINRTEEDVEPPTVSFIDPTPTDGATITRNWTFVNVSLSEPGNAILNWNGKNESMSGKGTNWHLNRTGLTNGTYSFKVFARDDAGNWGVSEAREIIILTEPGNKTPKLPRIRLLNKRGMKLELASVKISQIPSKGPKTTGPGRLMATTQATQPEQKSGKLYNLKVSVPGKAGVAFNRLRLSKGFDIQVDEYSGSSPEGHKISTPVFSVNESLELKNATLTLNKLRKSKTVNRICSCPDWDSEGFSCPNWECSDLEAYEGKQNSTHVWFTTDHFSAYAGASINVINVQSYPTVGGNWTVRFNTTGTADLNITAVNTTWDNETEDYDLKFLDLTCGNKTVDYEWTNLGPGKGSVYAENYSCDQTGRETSKVLTSGKHTLKFQFGKDTTYAENLANTYNPPDELYWENKSGGTPSPPPSPGNAGDQAAYDEVSSSDNNRWVTGYLSEAVSNIYDFQYYKYLISESSERILEINVSWEGRANETDTEGVEKLSDTWLYLWNFSASSWENVYYQDVQNGDPAKDRWMNYTISSGFSDYLGSNNELWVASRSNDAATCPILYSWNGKNYEYISDVSIGGSTGFHGYLNYSYQPSQPVDYAVMEDSQLEPENGTYKLISAEDLDEISYLDSGKLIKVYHPPGTELYSASPLYEAPPYPDEKFHTVRNPKPPEGAWNENGTSILPEISKADGKYTKQGTEFHYDTVTLDLGNLSDAENIKLVLKAQQDWVDKPPWKYKIDYAEVVDENGSWVRLKDKRTAVWTFHNPRTFAINITDWFKSDNYTLRLNHWHKIYYDYIAVDTSPDEWLYQDELELKEAELFHRESFYRKNDILHYNQSKGNQSKYKTYEYRGNFTRYGDVTELMNETDNKFAIMHPGDATRIEFKENKNFFDYLAGSGTLINFDSLERSYIFKSNAFYKMPFVRHLFGREAAQVRPLPFQDMSYYPYPENESFPWDKEHKKWWEKYQTREVVPETRKTEETTDGHNTMYTDYTDVTVTTSEPPKYSQNSVNSTGAGQPVEFRLKWTDDSDLSSYVFQFCNGTWDGASCGGGGWENVTEGSMSGSPDWSNETVTVNSTPGSTVGWCYYANDTDGLWNGSSCDDPFSFTTTDVTPPTYSLNSTNNTFAGQPTEFSLRWQDNYAGLSGYVFSLDNCTGSFENVSSGSLSGLEDWSNATGTLNETVGCQIRWKYYANDSEGNWNESQVYSFLTGETPRYSDVGDNSTAEVYPGDSVETHVNWWLVPNDPENLSTGILRTNRSGEWSSVSTCSLSGDQDWCNRTISLGPGDSMKTVCWRQWGNDTANAWNKTMSQQCFAVGNRPTNLTDPASSCGGDCGWGEKWTYFVNLTDPDEQVINVSAWYNRTGNWKLINSTNVSCSCDSRELSFVRDPGWDKTDVGTQYFKFNASDWVSGTNETDPQSVSVVKDDVEIILAKGVNEIINRAGPGALRGETWQEFGIEVNDTDRDVLVGSDVNTTFWFDEDGSYPPYFVSLENTTNSSGYASVYLTPNCSWSAGTGRGWKAGTMGDEYYKDANATQQTYDIYGQIIHDAVKSVEGEHGEYRFRGENITLRGHAKVYCTNDSYTGLPGDMFFYAINTSNYYYSTSPTREESGGWYNATFNSSSKTLGWYDAKMNSSNYQGYYYGGYNTTQSTFYLENETTTGKLLQDQSVSYSNITQNQGYSFLLNLTLKNTGEGRMYNANITNTSKPGWFSFNTSKIECGTLNTTSLGGERNCSGAVQVNISSGTPPGTYYLNYTGSWIQPNSSLVGSRENRTNVTIESNPVVNITEKTLNILVLRSNWNTSNYTIWSSGNYHIYNTTSSCLSGAVCTDSDISVDLAPSPVENISAGDTKPIEVNVSVAPGYSPGVYQGTVQANATDSSCSPSANCWDNVTLNVTVIAANTTVDVESNITNNELTVDGVTQYTSQAKGINVTLNNTGEGKAYYPNVTWELPSGLGWTASPTVSYYDNISAGESEGKASSITVDTCTSPGSYLVNSTATWTQPAEMVENGGRTLRRPSSILETNETTFNFTISENPVLNLTPENKISGNASWNRWKNVTNLTVNSTGNFDLNNIDLSCDSGDLCNPTYFNRPFEFYPNNFNLSKCSDQQVTIGVKPTSNAEAGESYWGTILVNATGTICTPSQDCWKEITLNVTVINEAPLVENLTVSPTSGGWGEEFNYSVDIRDVNGDDVNVSLWVNRSSGWEEKEMKNLTGGQGSLSWSLAPYDGSDVGTREYKFEYVDLNSSGDPRRDWANTSASGLTVEKDDVDVVYVSGDDEVVDRNGTDFVELKVRVNDTDRNQWVGSDVNTSLWVTTDGSSYYLDREDQLTDTSGFSNISFDPDSSVYGVGEQKWIIGTDRDEWYKDVNSSEFNVTIIGDLAARLDEPSGQAYRAGTDSVLFRWNLTDDGGSLVSGAGNTVEVKLNTSSSWTDITSSCSVNDEGDGWYNCTWDVPSDQEYRWYDVRVNASKSYFNDESDLFDSRFEVNTTNPSLSTPWYGYEEDGSWGEWWFFRANLTEPNNDTVNVSLWYDRGGGWELVNSTNESCPCDSQQVGFLRDPGWNQDDVGAENYKINVSDWEGGTDGTGSQGVMVAKDDLSISLWKGNGSMGIRCGGTAADLGVRLNDTDRNEVVGGETAKFYLFNQSWIWIGENQSDGSGYSEISYSPFCNVSIGEHDWKSNLTSTYWKDSKSSNFTLNVHGYSNMTDLSLPAEANAGEIVEIIGRVGDANKSTPVSNYPVKFWRNNSYLGSNQTQGDGRAHYYWNTSDASKGVHEIKVNITDNATVYYNVSIGKLTDTITIKRGLVVKNIWVDPHQIYRNDSFSPHLSNITVYVEEAQTGGSEDATVHFYNKTDEFDSCTTNADGNCSIFWNASDEASVGTHTFWVNATKAGTNASSTTTTSVDVQGKLYTTLYSPSAGQRFHKTEIVSFNATTRDENGNLVTSNVSYYNSSWGLLGQGNTSQIINWTIPASYSTGNETLFANTSKQWFGNSSDRAWVEIWGYSNVTKIYTLPVKDTYAESENITLKCFIQDVNSSEPVTDYPVNFYWNGTFIGSNQTKSNGNATTVWDTPGNASFYPNATFEVSCNISDNSTLNYNATVDEASKIVDVNDNTKPTIHWFNVGTPSTSGIVDINKEEVKFEAKVTDNVEIEKVKIWLEGEPKPFFSAPMADDGSGGDEVANDSVYTLVKTFENDGSLGAYVKGEDTSGYTNTSTTKYFRRIPNTTGVLRSEPNFKEIADVTYHENSSFALTVRFNNTGEGGAYSANISLAMPNDNFSSNSTFEECGKVEEVNVSNASRMCKRVFNITAFNGTPPGSYNITAWVNWTNPDNTKDSLVNTTTVKITDKSWTREPAEVEKTVYTGGGGTFTQVKVNNTGEIPLNFSIGGSGNASSMLTLSNQSLRVENGTSSNLTVNYSVPLDKTLGTYTYEIQIYNQTAYPPSWNTSLTVTVEDDVLPVVNNTWISKSLLEANYESVRFNASAFDNIGVDDVWAFVNSSHPEDTENVSMNPVGGNYYSVSYTPQRNGTHHVKIFANDTSGNENYTYAGSFEAVGLVNSSLQQVPQDLTTSKNITQSNNYTFFMNVSFENLGPSPGVMRKTNVTLDLPTGIYSNSTFESCGNLSVGENCSYVFQIDVTWNANVGGNPITSNLTWVNPDLSMGTKTNTTDLTVEANPVLNITQEERSVSIQHGTSKTTNFTIKNEGNYGIEGISITNISAPSNWSYSYVPQTISSLSEGGIEEVDNTITVPEYESPGIRNYTVRANATDSLSYCDPIGNCWDNLTMSVTVPEDWSWSREPVEFNQTLGINTSDSWIVTVNNTGNLDINFSYSLSGNFTDLVTSPSPPFLGNKLVQKGNSSDLEISYEVGTGDSGYYEGYVKIENDSANPNSRKTYFYITVSDVPPKIKDVNLSTDRFDLNFESLEVNATVSDNIQVDKAWIAVSGPVQENVTMSRSEGDAKEGNYTVEYSPPQTGSYTLRVCANDSAQSLENCSSSHSFDVVGDANISLSPELSKSSFSQITQDQGDSFDINTTLSNTGLGGAYFTELNVSPPSGWSVSPNPLDYGNITENTSQHDTTTVTIPAGTAPGTYDITLTANWTNPVQSLEQNSTTVSVVVKSNPVLDIVNDSLSANIGHGKSGWLSFLVNSTGNDNVTDINISCEGGECTNFSIGFDPQQINRLEPLSTQNINTSFSVPQAYPPGSYGLTVNASTNETSDTTILTVMVPSNTSWTRTPANFSRRVGTESTGEMDISVSSQGNVPLNFSLSISGDLSSNVSTNVSSFILPAMGESAVQVDYTAPSKDGVYTATVNISNSTADPTHRTTNLTLDVTAFKINITSPTQSSPVTEIVAGDIINITANATWAGDILTENLTFGVELSGPDSGICSSVNSTYSNTTSLWEINCSTPDVTDAKWYNLSVTGNYTTLNTEATDTETNTIKYADVSAPSFLQTEAPHTKLGESVNIRANLSDNVQVDTVLANVTYPNGSTFQWEMENETSDLTKGWWNLSLDETELGSPGADDPAYDLLFLANDTSGNQANATDWFDYYEGNVTFSGNSTDVDGDPVPLGFKFYRNDKPLKTEYLIHQFESSQEGNYSEEVHKRVYDIKIWIEGSGYNHMITLEGVNITGNVKDPLRFDSPTSPYRKSIDIPATRETLRALGVKSNLSTSSIDMILNFSGTDYESPDKIKIYKCSDPEWNFINRTCDGDWSEIGGTPDIGEETISYEGLDSFSAYALAENYCGDGKCQDWETVSSCPADCEEAPAPAPAEGGGGGGGVAAPPKEEKKKEKVPPFSLETDLIEATLHPGESKTYSIWISNNQKKNVTATLKVLGRVWEFIQLQRKKVEIAPGEVKTVQAKVFALDTTQPGVYTGDLRVKVGERTRTLPVTIMVVPEKEPLLDVKTQALRDTVTVNESIPLSVKLISMGAKKKFDIHLTYSVKRVKTEKTVAQKEEEFAIKTKRMSYAKRMKLTGIETGRYYIEVLAEYDNKTASSVDTFRITKPFWTQQRIYILVAILSAIGGAIGGWRLWKWYQQKKLEELRYGTPLDLDTLPRGDIWLGKIAESDQRAEFSFDELTTHILTAGATGSGKTVSAMVTVEEALEEDIPVIVFDPTAQWTGFVRPCRDEDMLGCYDEFGMDEEETKPYKGMIYEVTDPDVDIDFKRYMKPGEITVFTLNKLTPGEFDEAVRNIIDMVFEQGWEESPELELLIVFDEVHRLLEKYGGKGGYVALERGAREFRKWGIGMVMCSQVLADFKEAVKGNVLTEFQLHTKGLGDVDRVKKKYGDIYAERVTKEEVGVGMVQNPKYNNGRPWFVNFRPLYHSPHKLPDEELETYKKYSEQVRDLHDRIDELKEEGVETRDIEMDLKLAEDKLKTGAFRMAEIYLEGLESRVKGYEEE